SVQSVVEQQGDVCFDDSKMVNDLSGGPALGRRPTTVKRRWNRLDGFSQRGSLTIQMVENFLNTWMHKIYRCLTAPADQIHVGERDSAFRDGLHVRTRYSARPRRPSRA